MRANGCGGRSRGPTGLRPHCAARRPPAAGAAAQRSGRGGSDRGCGGRGRRRLPLARPSWDLCLRAYPRGNSARFGPQRDGDWDVRPKALLSPTVSPPPTPGPLGAQPQPRVLSPGRRPLVSPGHMHTQVQPSLLWPPVGKHPGLDPRDPRPPGGDGEELAGGPGRTALPSVAQPPTPIHGAVAVTRCPVTWGGPTLRNPPGAPRVSTQGYIHLGRRVPGLGRGVFRAWCPPKSTAAVAHSPECSSL